MASWRPNLVRAALIGPVLLLAACDNANGGGPGAVSEGEARALDEAAEMLEERALPDGVLPPTGAETVPAEDPPQEAASQ